MRDDGIQFKFWIEDHASRSLLALQITLILTMVVRCLQQRQLSERSTFDD